MTSSPTVNSWTEWGALELICVDTAEGMCYPDETPSYPWHVGPCNLHPYIRTICGPRPRHRIQQAQAQLDNLAELLRAESIKVVNTNDEILDEDIGKIFTRKRSLITSSDKQISGNGELIQKPRIDVIRPLKSSKEYLDYIR